MNWELAKQALKKGKKIRLPFWDKDEYWAINKYGKIIKIHKNNEGFTRLSVVYLSYFDESLWEVIE